MAAPNLVDRSRGMGVPAGKLQAELDSGIKKCTHCRQELPLSAFSKGGKNSVHGLRSQCKNCIQKITERRRDNFLYGVVQLSLTCISCGETKLAEFFHRDATRKAGRKTLCIECSSIAKAEKQKEWEEKHGNYAPEEKVCISCGEVRPRSEFGRDSSKKDRLQPYCRDCQHFRKKEWQGEYRIKNGDEVRIKSRRNWLKSTYGITEEDFFRILVSQGGGCGICKRRLEDDLKYQVDHDHVSGKIRGLLCKRCNMGLGLFGDSVIACRNAADYLERNLEKIHE